MQKCVNKKREQAHTHKVEKQQRIATMNFNVKYIKRTGQSYRFYSEYHIDICGFSVCVCVFVQKRVQTVNLLFCGNFFFSLVVLLFFRIMRPIAFISIRSIPLRQLFVFSKAIIYGFHKRPLTIPRNPLLIHLLPIISYSNDI